MYSDDNGGGRMIPSHTSKKLLNRYIRDELAMPYPSFLFLSFDDLNMLVKLIEDTGGTPFGDWRKWEGLKL